MLARLRDRNEWKFVGVLPKADPTLASRGGSSSFCAECCRRFSRSRWELVSGSPAGGKLGGPLGLVGIVFVLLQVLSPIHQAVGANLGTAPPRGSTIGSPPPVSVHRAWATLKIPSSLPTSRWPAISISA